MAERVSEGSKLLGYPLSGRKKEDRHPPAFLSNTAGATAGKKTQGGPAMRPEGTEV